MKFTIKIFSNQATTTPINSCQCGQTKFVALKEKCQQKTFKNCYFNDLGNKK